MLPALVMMEGPPGAGKSTIAEQLARTIRPVDRLSEEAIFTRAEFAEVGRTFRTKEFPTPELMLTAYVRLFAAARARQATVVADWNAVGMIEDLPCADPTRSSTTTQRPWVLPDADVLMAHARDVRRAWGGEAVLVVLDVSVDVAIRRAAAERGREWTVKQSRREDESTEGSELDRAIAFHARFITRRSTVVDVHRASGWRVAVVDATCDVEDVTASVLRELGAECDSDLSG